MGPTASNGVQLFVKEGVVYVQLQGQNPVEIANLTVESALPPVGTVIYFGAATLPNGWLECDGSELAATYTALNTALNGVYGTGANGRSRVPDLRGRAVLGAGAGTGLTNRAQGATGGLEVVELSTSEIPSHNHGLNDPGHGHGVNESSHSHGLNDPGHKHEVNDHDHSYDQVTYSFNSSSGDIEFGNDTYLTSAYSSTNSDSTSDSDPFTDEVSTGITLDSATTGITVNSGSTGISISSAGGGGSHENMGPWLALKGLIKF